jgi:hypothetical protein
MLAAQPVSTCLQQRRLSETLRAAVELSGVCEAYLRPSGDLSRMATYGVHTWSTWGKEAEGPLNLAVASQDRGLVAG